MSGHLHLLRVGRIKLCEDSEYLASGDEAEITRLRNTLQFQDKLAVMAALALPHNFLAILQFLHYFPEPGKIQEATVDSCQFFLPFCFLKNASIWLK